MSAEGRAQIWVLSLPDCPGFIVNSFEAGTSTGKDVYLDALKASAVQRVTADSSGFVKLYGDGDYRLQVTTADGVQLQDLDNVRLTHDVGMIWEGSNGTTLPAAGSRNKWQMFALHDGASTLSGIYMSNGKSFTNITSTFTTGMEVIDGVGDGVADDTAAITTAVTAAETNGTALLIPPGTYGVSSPIEIPTSVSVYGYGAISSFKALAGFPATFTSESHTFDAPVLFFNGLNSSDTVSIFEGFNVEGDNRAPVGIMTTGGSNHRFSNIRSVDATKANFIADSTQNTLFEAMRLARCPEYNLKVLNGVGNCGFVEVNCRKADTANVYFDADSTLPGEGIVSFTSPTQNKFDRCIWEDTLGSSKSFTIKMVDGDRNSFCDITLAGAAGEAHVDIESAAGVNRFERLLITCPAGTARAFRNNGSATELIDPWINAGTTTSIINLIECESKTTIVRPYFAGSSTSGKQIANISATPNNTTICQVTPYETMGKTDSRPDGSGNPSGLDPTRCDSTIEYFDQTIGEWIFYDYVNSAWSASGLSATVTFDPASLADGAGETKQVTVTGAALGDYVLVSAPYDLQDISVTGYVQAANTVEIRVQNESTATVDLASGTWRVRVLKGNIG